MHTALDCVRLADSKAAGIPRIDTTGEPVALARAGWGGIGVHKAEALPKTQRYHDFLGRRVTKVSVKDGVGHVLADRKLIRRVGALNVQPDLQIRTLQLDPPVYLEMIVGRIRLGGGCRCVQLELEQARRAFIGSICAESSIQLDRDRDGNGRGGCDIA